jgi:sugar O-acyltransferase (sialic acid O-acetyltransferase NeuD family)
MKEIYILGSGGLAKEVCFLLQDLNRKEAHYLIKGFVDVTGGQIRKVGGEEFQVYEEQEVLDKTESSAVHFAIGVGNPALIETLVKRFSKFVFPNLIHPGAVGDWSEIQMGQGNIITAGCVLTTNIQFGNFNFINLNCTIGHDTKINSFNVVNPGVNISGGVEIADGCLIGTGGTILQYCKIGHHSILGAGGVLTKDLPPKSLAVGVPAKVIKELT